MWQHLPCLAIQVGDCLYFSWPSWLHNAIKLPFNHTRRIEHDIALYSCSMHSIHRLVRHHVLHVSDVHCGEESISMNALRFLQILNNSLLDFINSTAFLHPLNDLKFTTRARNQLLSAVGFAVAPAWAALGGGKPCLLKPRAVVESRRTSSFFEGLIQHFCPLDCLALAGHFCAAFTLDDAAPLGAPLSSDIAMNA